MSPPTSPASSDADDIAKWEDERRTYREQVAKDDAFRDEMLKFAARTDTTLTHIQREQQLHAENDLRQFRAARRARKQLAQRVEGLSGQVTQTVTTNKYNWGVVAAWASAFVAIAGVGWALLERLGGAIAP